MTGAQAIYEPKRPGHQSPPPAGSKVLIKLAIGRLLIDTAIAGLVIDVRESDGRWTLEVHGVNAEDAAFIADNAAFLNLFYFEALPPEVALSQGSVQKYWMYDEHQPVVGYDAARAALTLNVGSYMAYSNEKV
ncbi:hypothetical protein DFQ01_13352 [Paenibacillus cellulosilyticus]|uniref:Uncharacterized protein n=1 Tax=Paenibacillus cellulosilyticus TaxID=375489 RepID=A0A2V2YV09_9BACL|nr:hypothetical protein [Paenibacillus cellulosilyticus]PWV94265.1 hypothetical protein DFQ01_13352 [Paenibacillus cellulosilyticus]QKS44247.1 hypothetical protein HUB94_07285 [Paenibacillus cellulosilyticus]